jgi:hypothetical protein
MLPPALSSDFANLADPVFRLTMMRDCIRAVQAPGTLWYPLLNLVATFIDGLASGAKSKTHAAYINYLKAHFPDLCHAVGADVFYENFRSAAVHEFGLKPGYAIGRDSGLRGAYADKQVIVETGQEIVVLNIDRLVSDFLAHVEDLLAQTRSGKAP